MRPLRKVNVMLIAIVAIISAVIGILAGYFTARTKYQTVISNLVDTHEKEIVETIRKYKWELPRKEDAKRRAEMNTNRYEFVEPFES
jgi:flagellar biosynthesis/type III secretory pathway M-ring protein FliF/YscJ